MQCRGIRGATTVSANNKERILAATGELLKEMAQANSVKVDDIAAIFWHNFILSPYQPRLY